MPTNAKQLEELAKKGVDVPGWQAAFAHAGLNLPQLLCFLVFWAVNMFVIYKGIESIRILLNIKAPLLIALGLLLLYWAYSKAGKKNDQKRPAFGPPGSN